jgi:hypothetical protein
VAALYLIPCRLHVVRLTAVKQDIAGRRPIAESGSPEGQGLTGGFKMEENEESVSELKEEEKAQLDEELENAVQESEGDDDSHAGQWILGLVLVGVGLFFLLGNVLPFAFLSTWWALFILLPAGFSLNRAWQTYRREGHMTSAARGSLIGGLMIGTVGIILLFGLDWGAIWPVFIIIVGVGALINARIG